MDEAQAGRVQKVFFQVVFPRGTILPAQHLFPASHSPHEGQMVTATVMAQQCFHLGEEYIGFRRMTSLYLRTAGKAEIVKKQESYKKHWV